MHWAVSNPDTEDKDLCHLTCIWNAQRKSERNKAVVTMDFWGVGRSENKEPLIKLYKCGVV